MAISIYTPKITESKDKPIAASIKGFPYQQLADPRRFEELVYTIYKNEIEFGSWKNIFDCIYLMQGVRERGQDCVLSKAKVKTGVIQCKHSKIGQRVTKPECCKEIIKFILHSIIDDELIPNIHNFTYYLVSSSGFAEPAKKIIDNFRTLILKEPELETWIQNIINSNSSLAGVSYRKDRIKIDQLLSNLTIKEIAPQDIDILLIKDYNSSIVGLFFEIRTVINNAEIKRLREDLRIEREYQSISNIPANVILDRFKIASFNLAEYSNVIENIPESHIERKETNYLFDWIKNPLLMDDLPICVLAGNAGFGKTVILRDLYDKLVKINIPVLGIKADKLYAKSLTELEKNKIQLEDGVDKIVKKLLQSFDKVVFIVDQLDALSQSLSSKREYLDTYNQLIQKLIQLDGVRIIASVRMYDLNFDTAFTYYKKQKIFKVGELDDAQLQGVLSKINLKVKDIPSKLNKLLRVPNNLNVFCHIYREDVGLLSIKTIHDLYKLFWKQILVLKAKEVGVDSSKCIQAVFNIASKMFHEQKICINSDEITNQFFEEIEFLRSNNVITEKNNDIQFFHQTFYDFVYSKKFVEEGGDILEHIKANDQNLFIRSSLVMVMSFLRINNESSYILKLRELIISRKIRFHLKLLIINSLAFESNPSVKEKQVVQTLILRDSQLRDIFLESVYSGKWLMFLAKKGFLNELLPNENKLCSFLTKIPFFRRYCVDIEKNMHILFGLVIRQLPNEKNIVLKILHELPEFVGKGTFILRTLHYLKEWDSQIAKQLFETYLEQSSQERFDYYRILEDAVFYDIDWVLKIYKSKLFASLEKIRGNADKLSFHHSDVLLLNKAFEADRKKAFNFYYEIVQNLIKRTASVTENDFYQLDIAFAFYRFEEHRKNTNRHYEEILHRLILEIKEQSVRNTDFFKSFVKNNLSSRLQTIVIFLIHAFISNPKDSIAEIFIFLETYFKERRIGSNQNIDFYTRKLIYASYAFLNSTQKVIINNLILSIAPHSELEVYINRDNQKTYGKFFGYTQYKYLKSIPEKERISDGKLKKRFQELERKGFEKFYTERESNRFGIASAVPPPLPPKAYENMKFDEWEKTFFEYREDLLYSKNGEMVSRTEHLRAFETRVAASTNDFYPFLVKLINEARVPHSYIIWGLQGLKKGNFNPDFFLELIVKASKLKLDRENTLYLIRLTDYSIQHKNINAELISFLSTQALTHPDPEEDDDGGGIQSGINSVRGAAAQQLIRAIEIKEHQPEIIKTLSVVVKDRSTSVRAALMHRLACLLNVDKQKTVEFFLELIDRGEDPVYEVSVWSAGYISYHYFSQLVPYFHKAIKNEKIQDDIAVVLAVKWLEGNPQSLPILNQVLKKSDSAKARMVEVALVNYKDKDRHVKRKCKSLFIRFLNSKSNIVSDAYSHEILRLDPDRFTEFYILLREYSNSRVARKTPHYFYEYIKDSAKNEPYKALELLKKHKGYKYDKYNEGYHEDDAIKALLNIYNTIRSSNNDEYSKAVRTCIRLFDLMLMNPSMRREAKAALEIVDS